MNRPFDQLMKDGAASFDEMDFGSARAAFAAALALAEAQHGPRSREVVAPLMWLAKATGELQQAPCPELEQQVAIERRGIVIAEETLAGDAAWLAHYLNMHGVTLWVSKHYEEAEAALRRALAVAVTTGKDSSLYEGTLADLLLDLGRPGEALVHARRSVTSAEGEDMLGLYRVGLCLRETGPKDEAREVFERFLAASPEIDPELRERVNGWMRDLA